MTSLCVPALISDADRLISRRRENPRSRCFIALAWSRHVAFVPYFAVAGSGRHRGPTEPSSETLRGVGQCYALSPAQVRIAWTLSLAPHMLAIPGTGNVEHLEQNVAAGAITLLPDDIQLLNG
jgi:pyridoxine 4-dehydrogenase